MLCDHPMSTSGVGTQSRFLIDGLLKTGRYQILVFGGAVKHESYEVIQPDPNLTIVPVDNFGGWDMARLALAKEKPDVMLLFTDPRFFIHIWEHEDEVHQICPIAYWHLWDQCQMPPTYNRVLYESTDLINCINYPTYEMVNNMFPGNDKTNWVPHAVPPGIYKELPRAEVKTYKSTALKGKPDDEFVGLWVNRNAHRKRPGDVLLSWKMFLDNLEKKYGHRKSTLIMHTDPGDIEGPNLLKIVEHLDINSNVYFSPNRVNFEEMNIFYNIADFMINISSAEGFGLPTLEAAYAGTPSTALLTGGLTRQIIDHRDGSENGIAIPVEVQRLTGSQGCPFIFEDHVSHKTVADAFMKMYELGHEGREKLGTKARAYVNEEFNYDRMIKSWDESLQKLVKEYKTGSVYKSWEMRVL